MSSKSFFLFVVFFFALNPTNALVDEVGDQGLLVAGILDNCSQKAPLEQGRCYEDSLRALLGLNAFDPEALAAQLDERAGSRSGFEFGFRTHGNEVLFSVSTTGELLDKCFSNPLGNFPGNVQYLDIIVNGEVIREVRNERVFYYDLCMAILDRGMAYGIRSQIDPTKLYVDSTIRIKGDDNVFTNFSSALENPRDYTADCQDKLGRTLFDRVDQYFIRIYPNSSWEQNTDYNGSSYWSLAETCRRIGL